MVGEMDAEVGIQSLERAAISPVNGQVLPANADTAARARAGKAAKRERFREAAAAGLLDTVQKLRAGVIDEFGAWQELTADQAKIALAGPLKLRTAAYAAVGRATGATETVRDELDLPAGGAALLLSGGAVE